MLYVKPAANDVARCAALVVTYFGWPRPSEHLSSAVPSLLRVARASMTRCSDTFVSCRQYSACDRPGHTAFINANDVIFGCCFRTFAIVAQPFVRKLL